MFRDLNPSCWTAADSGPEANTEAVFISCHTIAALADLDLNASLL